MSKIRGFVGSHLGAAIAAVAMAVVLVGGILVLTLVGGGGGTPAAAGSATTTTLAPTRSRGSGGAGAALRRQGVRGVITAIDGNTWTVASAAGAPVTVDVTATTSFGTKAVPLTASDFSIGDRIVVLGARSGSTVTATRVAKAPASGGPTTTTTTTPLSG